MRQMLVFDPRIWKAHDYDVAQNAHCWQLGTLIEEYKSDDKYKDRLACVQWLDGSVTCGHFVSAMRPANH